MLYFPLRDGFSDETRSLALPLAGPALASSQGFEEVSYWGLALDTFGQLGGVGLVTFGLTLGDGRNRALGDVAISAGPGRMQLTTNW